MFGNITDWCEKAVADRVFPGCSVGILVNGTRWCRGFGRYTYDPASPAVTPDTVYDVASVTKAIPVALLALLCIDRGFCNPGDTMITFLPEYTGAFRDDITIRHLLTHTLDFGFRLSALRDKGSDAIIAQILGAPLASPPGTVYAYANATSILLGMVVERIMKLPLGVAAEKELFRPLQMNRTTFYPETLQRDMVVPTEIDRWRGRCIQGEVHDESAFALRPRVVGSAGLFSTAADIMLCTGMLLDGGYAGERFFFGRETVALMHTNACPVRGVCTGFGWELNQPVFMGSRCGASTFGKTGFTGCSVVIDPVRKVSIVLLANHVFPHRRGDRSLINTIRAGLADRVYDTVDT